MPLIAPKLNPFELDIATTAAHYHVDLPAATAIVLIEEQNRQEVDRRYQASTEYQVAEQITTVTTLSKQVFASIKDVFDTKQDAQSLFFSKNSLSTTPSLTMDFVCILLGRGNFVDPLWKELIASSSQAFFCSYHEKFSASHELPRLIKEEVNPLLESFKQGLEIHLPQLTVLEISQFAILLTCIAPSSHVNHLAKVVKEQWLLSQVVIKEQYTQIHTALEELSKPLPVGEITTELVSKYNNIFQKLNHLMICLSYKGWGEDVGNIAKSDNFDVERRKQFKQEYERIYGVVSYGNWTKLSILLNQLLANLAPKYGETAKDLDANASIKIALNKMIQDIRSYLKVLPEIYDLICAEEASRAASPSSSRKYTKIERDASSSSSRQESPLSARGLKSSSSSIGDGDSRTASPSSARGTNSVESLPAVTSPRSKSSPRSRLGSLFGGKSKN